MQEKGRLESEQVAGGEAARYGSGFDKSIPDGDDRVGRGHDLVTVLSRVPCAGGQDGLAVDVYRGDSEGADLVEGGAGYLGEGGLCRWALNGDHGEPVGGVIDLDGAVGGGPFAEPCRDGVTVARVGDVEVTLLAEAVDDVVVDDSALFVAGHAVLGASQAELGHIGAEYPAHERARAPAR